MRPMKRRARTRVHDVHAAARRASRRHGDDGGDVAVLVVDPQLEVVRADAVDVRHRRRVDVHPCTGRQRAGVDRRRQRHARVADRVRPSRDERCRSDGRIEQRPQIDPECGERLERPRKRRVEAAGIDPQPPSSGPRRTAPPTRCLQDSEARTSQSRRRPRDRRRGGRRRGRRRTGDERKRRASARSRGAPFAIARTSRSSFASRAPARCK